MGGACQGVPNSSRILECVPICRGTVQCRGIQDPVGQGGYLCHVVARRGVLEFKWSGGRGPPALAEAAEMGDLSQTRY